MMRVALRGLGGRKLRTALTAVAIVLGVAMVSGTYVLTDTIGKAFDEIFTSSYDDTDAVVTGRSELEWSASGPATVPASLVERIEALPGVEAAAGTMMNLATGTDEAKLIDRDGEPIVGSNPTFGFGLDPSAERFSPLDLAEGRWAESPREVVVDVASARDNGFAVGDRIEITANGPKRPYEIVGLARLGDVGSLGGATIAVFELETAQRLYGKVGRFDAISVAAKKGVTERELVAQIRPLLPAAVEVKTAEAKADEDAESIAEFVSFIRYALLAFGGIALFVGAFVIFNTLSITVAQRTRELATLRTLGASRRQVLRSVIVEAVALGVAASVVGLAAGVGLAHGMKALIAAVGLDLPTGSMVFEPRTAIVSLLVGILVTTVAGVVPAVRATRIAPIAAVREGAAVPGMPRRRGTVAGLVLLVVGLGAVSWGLFGSSGSGGSILSLVVGALASFVGLALVASRLVKPIAKLVGHPARRFGGAAGRLAQENAIRNPARTAATAAALMIGLALVTMIAVLGDGLQASARKDVARQIAADYVLGSGNGWSPIPVEAGEALGRADGIAVASGVRTDRARIGAQEVDVSGIDPATIHDVYRFDWVDGSAASVRGAVVRRDLAEDQGLRVGSTIALRTPGGEPLEAVVRGIYEVRGFAAMLGHVVLPTSTFESAFPRARDAFVLAKAEPGAERAALERAVAAFPDAALVTADEFVDSRLQFLVGVLNLFYVLLALSVVVSLFGMVNTLVLSVFERTRELGMLRAVGMTRRQVRRMIRHESVITALIGASLGLALGLAFAALITYDLANWGVEFAPPLATLAVFVVVAVAAGIVAAVLPARRAARLNVLEALQYE